MGGLQPKKTENYRKVGTGFFSVFFGYFRFFRFWPILTDLTGSCNEWFLLVIIAFIRHLQGFTGIKCVIRQFLASLDLIVDMIFESLELLVVVQTEKKPKKYHKKPKKTKNTEKYRKNRKKTEKYRKNRTLPQI